MKLADPSRLRLFPFYNYFYYTFPLPLAIKWHIFLRKISSGKYGYTVSVGAQAQAWQVRHKEASFSVVSKMGINRMPFTC